MEQEGISSSPLKEKEKHEISVTIDCIGASEIFEQLSETGIYAWNDRGLVRFSSHGYNSLEDIERIVEVFPSLWRK